MRRFFGQSLLFLLTSVLFSSCSYYFYAAVTSRGTAPSETSYYITHDMGEDVDYLEFKEYSNLLKTNLNSLGYVNQNENSANLNIHLNYYIGNKEVVSTSSSSSNYSVNSATWNAKSNKTTTSSATANAIGFSNIVTASGSGTSNSKATTNVNKNSYTYGGGSTTTTVESGAPCYLIIEAINTINNLPEWKVEIESFIDSPSSFPKVIPWMMLLAKKYIGQKYSGKISIVVKKHGDYNLPNVEDLWLLQSDYFKNTDLYIKAEALN